MLPKVSRFRLSVYSSQSADFLPEVKTHSSKLKHLAITISDAKTDLDSYIQSLSGNLASFFPNLESFQLNIESCFQISNNCMCLLSKTSREFPYSLKEFKISFDFSNGECNISNDGLDELSEMIEKKLGNIENLSLDLPNFKVTNHGFSSFIGALQKGGYNLKNLTLNFWLCKIKKIFFFVNYRYKWEIS